MEQNLKKAIFIVGGVPAMARELEITPQAVRQWKRSPVLRASQIEEITSGRVSRYALRPDVFGAPPK